MDKKEFQPINSFLITGAALFLFAALCLCHHCGLLNLISFWHYWLVLITVG